MFSFAIVVAENGGVVKVCPLEAGDSFPVFEEVTISAEGDVVGWGERESGERGAGAKAEEVAGRARNDGKPHRVLPECFDFGRLGRVEFVKQVGREVFFRRLPPTEPNKIAPWNDSAVREIARELGKLVIDEKKEEWDWKFVNTVSRMAVTAGVFSAKQAMHIYRLLYKYRIQLPALYQKHSEHPLCCDVKQKVKQYLR